MDKFLSTETKHVYRKNVSATWRPEIIEIEQNNLI